METNVLGDSEAGATLNAYHERLTAPRSTHAPSLQEWEERRLILRKRVQAALCLDPWPERVPLDVHYGGMLDRADYTIRRVYYQAWPGIYSSGWLYSPKTPGKHPAILSPHGHWPTGALDVTVQSRGIAFAKKGYVAFTPDMAHLPEKSYLIGLGSTSAQVWTCVRALDYLQSLPEVDEGLIGCVGASGGGLQTLYMMAIDDRIQVTVPAVYMSYYRRIMDPDATWSHCNCNWVPGLLGFTDQPEIAATFAPKAAFYLSVTGDWTKTVPEDEFKQILSVYRLYGREDMTGVRQWESNHAFLPPMRECAYGWFDDKLSGNAEFDSAEPELVVESVETMRSLDDPSAPAKFVTIGERVELNYEPVTGNMSRNMVSLLPR